MRKSIKTAIIAIFFSVMAVAFSACTSSTPTQKTKLEIPLIESTEYNGELQKAVVPENDGYRVTKNDGGTSVGEYDVVLTLTDGKKYEWTAHDEGSESTVTLKFEITKADNEIISLVMEDRNVGEEGKAPVAQAKFGVPSFTYSDKANGQYKAEMPTTAGKYFVKATVAETADYKGAEKVVSFLIRKNNVATFTKAPTKIDGIVYDTLEHELVTAGETNDGTVQYKLGENGEWSDNIPTATEAGEYEVFYRILGDETHDDLNVEDPIVVTIAENTITEPTANVELVYNGEEQELVTAGEVAGKGTFMYKLGDGEWSETVPTATNAGDYTVYYKVNVDGVETQEKSLSVNIAKATNAIEWQKNGNDFISMDIDFGSEPAKLGIATFGTITYKYTKAKLVDEQFTQEGTPADWELTNGVGVYCCIATVEGTDNYTEAENVRYFTVHKATNAIEWQKDGNDFISMDIDFGSEPLKLGIATFGTITYKYTKAKLVNGQFTQDGTPADWDLTNGAGVYCCIATVEGTDNYTEAENSRYFTVRKVTAKNQVYYEFDSDSDCYYVSGCEQGLEVVNVVDVFNNGENGEKAVKYVKESAFKENQDIRRVILPASVIELKGLAFFNCGNLEYLDMRGVTTFGDGNNVTFCYNLTTVIVKEGITIPGQQFQSSNESKNGVTTIYVDGTAEITIENADLNKLIGKIIYKGTADKCNVWYFENDVIKTSGDHSYTDGKCGRCGLYNETLTQGVVYKYESASDSYYVGDNNSLAVSEVTILGTYNDGKHGEKAVTYVKNSAFKENPHIRRVILPASVTELKGLVFFGCGNLEYLDMRGVTTFGDSNNVTFCYNLTTVIVKEGITITLQQFQSGDESKNGVTTIYVDGTAEITIEYADLNKLIGKIIYKGTKNECNVWYFENDVIKISGDHSYGEDGKCTVCGLYGETLTQGVVYKYDSVSDSYYVGDNRSLAVSEVKILGTYNDGKHGEKAVTYVAMNAFIYNNSITKVILPESVTTLGGGVFMHCVNLEYVDMRGVSSLIMTNAPAGPDGSTERNNNFLGCSKLTTIVVGKAFKSDVGQFHDTNKPNLYVYGTASDGAPSTADISKVGNIYYYDANGATGCWNYNGDVVTLH